MSETELLGRRMGMQLLTSGFLSSVEIELREKEFVLFLTPSRVCSSSYERIMRFCVNFLGESRPQTCSHELFCWGAAFAEVLSGTQICRIWVCCDFYSGYDGFDTLTELVLLGLRLSAQPDEPVASAICSSTYRLEDLMRIYQTKEEALAATALFVRQVIQTGDDFPTETCEPALRVRWTCCSKHRTLFLQRLLFAEWLRHLLDLEKGDRRHDEQPASISMAEYPSVQAMQQRLLELLAQTYSPQAWLCARFTYKVQLEQGHWERLEFTQFRGAEGLGDRVAKSSARSSRRSLRQAPGMPVDTDGDAQA